MNQGFLKMALTIVCLGVCVSLPAAPSLPEAAVYSKTLASRVIKGLNIDSSRFCSRTYLVEVLISQTSVMSLSSYSRIIMQSGEIMPTLCS